MPSAGPNGFSSSTDDAAVGTVAWVDGGETENSNDSYATAALNNQTSHYLKFLDAGLAVPGGATVNGIAVAIERSAAGGGGNVTDATVKLVKGGAVVGDNKATASAWPGADATATYGGAADLWGTTWTAAEVNAADFGFVLACVETFENAMTARVDYASVTVYYTAAASPVGAFRRRTRFFQQRG